MHHLSSDGQRHFSSRDPGKALCLHSVAEKHRFWKLYRVFVVFFSTPGKSCMGITMSFPCSDMPLRIMLTMLMGFTLPCALTEAFQLLSHSSTSHRVSESAHSTPVFIYFFCNSICFVVFASWVIFVVVFNFYYFIIYIFSPKQCQLCSFRNLTLISTRNMFST